MNEPTQEERNELVNTVMWVMQEWELESDEKVRLLGLPDKTPTRALQQYRQGKPFPDEAVFLKHAEMILALHRTIRTFFPGNPAMANLWITTPSNAFAGKMPLEIMLTDGLRGMQYCLDHLNGEHW